MAVSVLNGACVFGEWCYVWRMVFGQRRADIGACELPVHCQDPPYRRVTASVLPDSCTEAANIPDGTDDADISISLFIVSIANVMVFWRVWWGLCEEVGAVCAVFTPCLVCPQLYMELETLACGPAMGKSRQRRALVDGSGVPPALCFVPMGLPLFGSGSSQTLMVHRKRRNHLCRPSESSSPPRTHTYVVSSEPDHE